MGGNNKAKTSTAPSWPILAADHDFHDELAEASSRTSRAPVTCSPATTRCAPGAATLNATLQVAYFILGVRAAGLAAGPMTGFDADGVDREFFPDGEHRALVRGQHRPAPAERRWMDRLPRLDYDEVVTTV